jgi:hypothetical protein
MRIEIDSIGHERAMTEQRFEDEPEEPGDPLDKQEEDEPAEGEPWAKTSSGDADKIVDDD